MIHWIPVEGYFNQKYIAAHQIKELQVTKVASRHAKPDSEYQVKAKLELTAAEGVTLKTASLQTCQLFIIELCKQSGSILEPFAKFGPEKKAPTEPS